MEKRCHQCKAALRGRGAGPDHREATGHRWQPYIACAKCQGEFRKRKQYRAHLEHCPFVGSTVSGYPPSQANISSSTSTSKASSSYPQASADGIVPSYYESINTTQRRILEPPAEPVPPATNAALVSYEEQSDARLLTTARPVSENIARFSRIPMWTDTTPQDKLVHTPPAAAVAGTRPIAHDLHRTASCLRVRSSWDLELNSENDNVETVDGPDDPGTRAADDLAVSDQACGEHSDIPPARPRTLPTFACTLPDVRETDDDSRRIGGSSCDKEPPHMQQPLPLATPQLVRRCDQCKAELGGPYGSGRVHGERTGHRWQPAYTCSQCHMTFRKKKACRGHIKFGLCRPDAPLASQHGAYPDPSAETPSDMPVGISTSSNSPATSVTVHLDVTEGAPDTVSTPSPRLTGGLSKGKIHTIRYPWHEGGERESGPSVNDNPCGVAEPPTDSSQLILREESIRAVSVGDREPLRAPRYIDIGLCTDMIPAPMTAEVSPGIHREREAREPPPTDSPERSGGPLPLTKNDKAANGGKIMPPRSGPYCRSCLRDPCTQPVAMVCGHVFCLSCIIREIEASCGCPVCNKLFLVKLSV